MLPSLRLLFRALVTSTTISSLSLGDIIEAFATRLTIREGQQSYNEQYINVVMEAVDKGAQTYVVISMKMTMRKMMKNMMKKIIYYQERMVLQMKKKKMNYYVHLCQRR